MKTHTLKVTDEQLSIIQSALDMYSRIGIGQFDVILKHPTFETHLRNIFDKDYGLVHEAEGRANMLLYRARNVLTNDHSYGSNGSWGIFNENVDYSCRMAFDIIQVIRHERWKLDEKRSNITVDSSIHFSHTKDDSSKLIKCKINNV